MEFSLPEDVLGGLPEPDSQGLVRVTAGLRLTPDGRVRVVELNDMPLPTSEKEATGSGEEDDETEAIANYQPPDLASALSDTEP